MPAYIGNKKVKELYYGGKKIKEAWYEGKKVYSAVKSISPWRTSKDYALWDRVVDEGIVYECIKAHTSDSESSFRNTNRPALGWDAYSYWRQIGYAYEFGL